jgi:PAS domain S-box-containing protein/putative nucleotidyltransferase with HDIG domain
MNAINQNSELRIPNSEIIRVLLIEDNPGDARVIREMLAEGGGGRFKLECVTHLLAGLERLVEDDIEVVFLDLGLPDSQGFDTFAKAYAQAPRVPIIVLSGLADEQLAIKTVQEGAQDYLVKGHLDSHALVRAIRHAIERKRVQEELRGQALVFENIHDSIIMTDLEGNIIRWNPAAEQMFGYYEEEAFRKTLSMLTTRITNGQLHDGRWAGEMDFTRKDGTEGVCETTVIPLCDEHGTITAVFGVCRDITERKQTEEALKKSVQLLRDTGEMAKVGGWELDLSTKEVLLTEEVSRIHGVEPGYKPKLEEALNFYAPESRPALEAVLKKAAETGEPYDLESLFIPRGSKDKIWVRSLGRAVYRGGKIVKLTGTFQNIDKYKQAEQALQKSYHQVRETLITTVNTLSSTAEMRDPYTAGHQRRVTILACAIAEEMGITQEQFDGLRLAGLIHDIGKIAVPVEILSRPGRIGETEFNIIMTHPQAGCNLLREIEFPWPVAQIVLQHHERMDGSGYPRGLRDGGIILEARILAVADVVEAMASHRPYRPALGIEAALAEITNNKGILYDHDVVDSCLRLFIEKGFTIE